MFQRFRFLQRLRERGQAPRTLLLLGIAIRILAYFFLYPENNDKHAAFVKFIADNRRLPLTRELAQAHHPPLYYILAAPLWAWSGSLKVVQLFSLACCIATLIVLYRLIYREGLIESAQARLYSFLIACFLPQFVMFGLYISNDTLTCLLGCVALWQAHRYIRSPGSKQLVLLAAVTGLGLLTRLNFLAFIPPFLVLILWVSARPSPWRAVGGATAFLAIALTLGSYKFVENYLHYGDPFLNSMDDLRLDPVGLRSYRGIASYMDFNLVALLEKPTLSRDRNVPDNRGSFPLLFYGSFWYQEIPESNWTGNLDKRLKYLGSAIYAVALIPSFFFFAGLAALGKRLPEFVRHFDPSRPADQRLLTYYVAVTSLFMILAILLLAMNKYHLWSIMQARYLFPALFGGVSAFAVGIEICGRSRLVARGLNIGMMLLVGLFVLYFASEIGLRLRHA